LALHNVVPKIVEDPNEVAIEVGAATNSPTTADE
jgi:hypothetical protein